MKRPDWQEFGKEPDYRITLANERTFLAWIRTALAILAGGVLLDQVAVRVEPTGMLARIAIGLSLLAAAMAACAYHRWRGNEMAMRRSGPLPASPGVPLLGSAIFCVALMVAIGLIARLR